ncbi:MAG TPA: hypothetical protein VFM77_18855, partial [Terriglobales bacterium]|nr:hypothetical protein [Terriglobales bacterium]
ESVARSREAHKNEKSLHTYERPTSLLAVGLELESLSLLPAQRPPQTVIRVPLIRMGIDETVWDVNGIKTEYTGNRQQFPSRFFDQKNRKRC